MDIIYEDRHVCVIDKPPGIVVNNAKSVKGKTVQDWAAKRLVSQVLNDHVDKASDFYRRAGVVHRLDKDTSGCLVLAKSADAFVSMQRLFKERSISKVYRAIAHGIVRPKTGVINAPVGRLPWNRKRFGIVPGGKSAESRYRAISEHNINNQSQEIPCTYIEVSPKTGRTHQIRVHLRYINHPILGDTLYAGRKVSRRDAKIVPRIMLHAYHIGFSHPVTRKKLEIYAPIPDDMNVILKHVCTTRAGSDEEKI